MSAERIAAGLSLLFAPGERPDAAGLQAAFEAGQTRAQIGWLHADGHAAQVIVDGLAFDCDGLALGVAADQSDVLRADPDLATCETIRFYPGEHLSGGPGLEPVVRALLGLAVQLATSLPVRGVYWAPAQTLSEPATFIGPTLAWLAGGAFPATGLVALIPAGDDSVSTRGLAHFIGQELTLRVPSRSGSTRAADLAARVIDRLVATGPLTTMTQIALPGLTLCAEPAQHARQILAWPMLETQAF